MSRANKIVGIAGSYVGIIEKPNNQGFWNAAFQKLMIGVGFYLGAAWCAFFVKLVFVQAYADNVGLVAVIKNCFTGGALDTYSRVKANGTFATGLTPKYGAIAVCQLGKTTKGHMWIVSDVDLATNTQKTIEGNTNASGSREGNCVARKLRTINRAFKADGLNIVGYIYPLEAN